jgi:hypothetical protein
MRDSPVEGCFLGEKKVGTAVEAEGEKEEGIAEADACGYVGLHRTEVETKVREKEQK